MGEWPRRQAQSTSTTSNSGEKTHKILSSVKKNAEEVNRKRNAVAHQGEFCNAGESQEVIESARKFIHAVVRIYEPTFTLKDKSSFYRLFHNAMNGCHELIVGSRITPTSRF